MAGTTMSAVTAIKLAVAKISGTTANTYAVVPLIGNTAQSTAVLPLSQREQHMLTKSAKDQIASLLEITYRQHMNGSSASW